MENEAEAAPRLRKRDVLLQFGQVAVAEAQEVNVIKKVVEQVKAMDQARYCSAVATLFSEAHSESFEFDDSYCARIVPQGTRETVAASRAAGLAAVRFVNTHAMKTVGKVGDGLSREGIRSGLTKMGDVGAGVMGATVSGTRTGLTTTMNATVGVVNLGVNATMEGAGRVAGGVEKLLGRDKLDTTSLEVDEGAWHSWSRAAAARREAGETVDDDLDFRDMARLEKLKARAIEWEQQGHAEELAAAEALAWLDDLPADPLECSAADFDDLTEELARLSLRLQHDTVDTCKANWVDFKQGLKKVEALEQELIAAKFVCAKGRESLGSAVFVFVFFFFFAGARSGRWAARCVVAGFGNRV
jgi:hypothetical protein